MGYSIIAAGIAGLAFVLLISAASFFYVGKIKVEDEESWLVAVRFLMRMVAFVLAIIGTALSIITLIRLF